MNYWWWERRRLSVICAMIFISTSFFEALDPRNKLGLEILCAISLALIVGAIFDVVEKFYEKSSQDIHGL